jgi:hypothetical protein
MTLSHSVGSSNMKSAALAMLVAIACAPMAAQNGHRCPAIPESRESLPAYGALVVARR